MIRNMVKFFSGVIVMLAAVSACAIPVTGPGFMPLGEVDTYGLVNYNPEQSVPTKFYRGGFYLVISGSPRSHQLAECINEQPYTISNIPGTSYYGVEVKTGIYLVFYDSVINSQTIEWRSDQNTNDLTRVIRFDSNGQMQGGSEICVGEVQIGYNILYTSGMHQVSGILKYGLYVTPEAVSGTDFNLSFYVYRALSAVINVTKPIQVNLVNCSVATPALIEFGDILAGSTAPVINNSNIGIDCSGNEPSTMSIKYSMESLSDTANDTSLMMKNPQNELQGYVRGFIGPNARAEAGCTDASSSMRFNQDPIPLLEGVKSNGLYSLDLNWVLCPDATPGLGEGTASAVLNITWP